MGLDKDVAYVPTWWENRSRGYDLTNERSSMKNGGAHLIFSGNFHWQFSLFDEYNKVYFCVYFAE